MLERPSKLVSYRFDQLADQINKRVMPDEADVDRYVGLEHLDPDSLRIRRWGDTNEVESTKLLFQPGDIIFGKRRVYQRKVAVADFEGICSAHAMVLRAKPESVLPEFLPFFMQSDLFMERALSISVGSLSPTINWKALAKEEFLLPPIQEQARLVEGLSSSRELAERLEDTLEASAQLHAAFVLQLVEQLRHSADNISIGEIAEVQYGLTVNRARRHKGATKPYLRVANVQRGRFDFDEIKEIGVLDGDDNFTLRDGDVLVVEGHANRQEIGRAAIWQGEIADMMHQNHLIRIRAGSQVESRFICELINSPVGQEYFQSRAKSSSGLNTINSTVVREFRIPLPPIETQRQELAKLDQISDGAANIEKRLLDARRLFKMLLNEAR